jgi:DinB family protein
MSVFTNPASGSVENAKAYTAAVLGLLGSRDPIAVLRETPVRLRSALEGLSDAQISMPEAPGKWSFRQVLAHLADSELVWGWRLRLILTHDRPLITGYDQDAWADRLGYSDVDVQYAIDTFRLLRQGNLRLVSSASPQDLDRFGVHAERGEESVRHLIGLYAGHDILHLNQLDRIRKAVAGGAAV